MKTNVTVVTVGDILSFAEIDLKIFWNQAHEDLTEFIQRSYESPFNYLQDHEDLFSLTPQGHMILDKFIEKHKLKDVEVLVTK